MFDAHKQNPEQRFVAEGKNEREKSVTAIVYDAFSRAWDKRAWEDVTYAQLEVVFRSVFEHGSNELGIEVMPHKLGSEYKMQLIAAISDQISVIIPDIEEDQWGEVFERFAKSVPEEQEKILQQALLVLKPSEEQKWNRMKIARMLIDLDQTFFVELSSFGFTRKDEVNIARRASEKNGTNLFAFVAAAGGLTEEFQEAVFTQFSLGREWYIDYKKPSPQEATKMIQQADASRREQWRETFQIPKRKVGLDEKIISSPENEFEKSFPIHVDEMHALGDRLMDAIQEADPTCRDKLRERKEQEKILFGPISVAGEMNMDTSADPIFLYMEGNEITPTVYKPQCRDDADLREGIPAGTYAQREWLAYQIDQALGIDVIPPTILRDGPEGVGSVQSWVIGKIAFSFGEWRTKANQEQLEDVAFDDVVKQNQDRHDGNFLIGHDGSVHAIDHGLILSVSRDPGFIKSASGFRFMDKSPSDRVVERIHAFESASDVQLALRACFDAALGADAEEAWKKFHRGLAQLAPKDGTQGKYPFMYSGSIGI